MIRYPHLAHRIFNTPLMIAPGKLDAIVAGLGARLLGAEIEGLAPEAISTAPGERRGLGYRVTDSGVAVLEVFGILAHRTRLDANSSTVLGYETVAEALDHAMADPKVGAILLNLDTPGGEVNGAFDLAGRIRAARAVKPVWAVAGDHALSAGYLLASAASRVAVTQTGQAGSIGVVLRHVDMSLALEKDGLRVTQVFAGARKVDGNPYEPLSPEVLARLQAEVGRHYELFVATVAAQRGIEPQAVRTTEAAVYPGEDAVRAGLADLIATPDEMIAELARLGAKSTSRRAAARANPERSQKMAESNAPGGDNQQPETVFTQSDMDRARAEGQAAGLKAGTEQERARTAAILTHAEADGRETLARQCVANGLTAEQAGAILAASPRASAPAAPGNTFSAAMQTLGNPDVRPDAGNEGPNAEQMAAGIVALFQPRKAA